MLLCRFAQVLPSKATLICCACDFEVHSPVPYNCQLYLFGTSFCRSVSSLTVPGSFGLASASYVSSSIIASQTVFCSSCFVRRCTSFNWILSFSIFQGVCSDLTHHQHWICVACGAIGLVLSTAFGCRKEQDATCCGWPLAKELHHVQRSCYLLMPLGSIRAPRDEL